MTKILKDKILKFVNNSEYKESISAIYLFGSYARGEEKKSSDLDLLIQYTKGSKLSLFDHVKIQKKLSEECNKDIDLIEKGSVNKYLKKYVNKDLDRVY